MTYYLLIHSIYFGLSLSFALYCLYIWTVIRFDHRITKNKLTLQPYLYMLVFFLSCIAMDFMVIFDLDEDGDFQSFLNAYCCEMVYFFKLMFVLLAFGI